MVNTTEIESKDCILLPDRYIERTKQNVPSEDEMRQIGEELEDLEEALEEARKEFGKFFSDYMP